MKILVNMCFPFVLLCCMGLKAQSTDIQVVSPSWEILAQKIESQFMEIPSRPFTRSIVAILINTEGDILTTKTMNHALSSSAELELLNLIQTFKVDLQKSSTKSTLIYLSIEFIEGKVVIKEVKS